MSEIEKLYANAEVKPFRYCYNCVDNNGNRIENSANCPSRHNCSNTCDTPEYEFTAEKQLEITKFLLKKAVYYDVKDDKYWFYYEECESAGYKPFDEAIAHFINKLWQNLTTEEKQQVKGILE